MHNIECSQHTNKLNISILYSFQFHIYVMVLYDARHNSTKVMDPDESLRRARRAVTNHLILITINTSNYRPRQIKSVSLSVINIF